MITARLASALSLFAWLGCRAVYPIPEPTAAVELRSVTAPRDSDMASVDRVRSMESSCRLRRRGETLRRASDAMDRVRASLGAYCDLDALGGDPLRWRVRCRADGFFALGEYRLGGPQAPVTCSALSEAPTDRWTCAGALLHSAVRVEGRSAGHVDLVTVGGADQVALAENSRFDGCPVLRTALSPGATEPWFSPSATATVSDRQRGNEQLAWCRAAAVYRSLRCGVYLAASGVTPVAGAEPCVSWPSAAGTEADRVLGAGTGWMTAHPTTACSAQPPGTQPLQGWCPEARRVDVLVNLVPSADPVAEECPDASRDPSGALSCLQRCLEHQAAVVRVETPRASPLFVPCSATAPLPEGWISAPPWRTANLSECRAPDLSRLREALGFGP